MIPSDRRGLRERNRQYPRHLTRIPDDQWPITPAFADRPIEVWRSRAFFVMVYVDGGYERLSVVRTMLGAGGGWAEGIAWEDLQRIKHECGRGTSWAVEVYPDDAHVVNEANMRHLFVLPGPPPYGWKGAD